MMNKRIRYGLILILLAVIGFAIYMAQHTSLNVSSSNLEEGKLSVESDFPNARCRKVVQSDFPPVTLECEEKPVDQP